MNLSESYVPGQTIGIIGGGQLGRMLAFSAKEKGFQVGVLDPEKGSPASQVADWQIIAQYDDEAGLRKLAERSDVITYEFENVDVETLRKIEHLTNIPQGSDLLAITQDRLLEKAFLEEQNINIAPYATIIVVSDIQDSIDAIGYPCVLKTTRGGYDGKGQHVMRSLTDVKGCVPLLQSGPCVLESWIPFDKELSVMVARNGEGEIQVFPVVENVHRNNILHQTFAPAQVDPEVAEEATRIGKVLAEALKLRGVLGIEMFMTETGALYVNELAPRPHNSGHYSIEACSTSQFDAHIRGVANWPLPEVKLLSGAVMVNILGQHVNSSIAQIPQQPDWHFHYYGKDTPKVNRKMGHITILTEDHYETKNQIRKTNVWLDVELEGEK